MQAATFLTLISLFAILGPIMDKIATESLKGRAYRDLLSLNRRSFAKYVAGTALSAFESVFDNKFRSVRFLLRSAVLTLLLSALSLAFLYFYLPQTYFGCTSYIRTSVYIGTNYLAVFSPIIIFVIFDYLCNGQTKLFLALMKSSPSFGAFLVIGYSDLVITTSIGVVSLSISFVVFSYLSLTSPITGVPITLDFSKLHGYEEHHVKAVEYSKSIGMSSYVVYATLKYTKNDATFNQRDFELVNKYPQFRDGGKIVYARNDEVRTIRFMNKDGIITSFITDEGVLKDSALITMRSSEDGVEQFCRRVSSSIRDGKFGFILHRGWDESRVYNGCIKGETVETDIDLSVNVRGFNYKRVAADMAGSLIRLTLNSITGGFSDYLADGPIEIYNIHSHMRDPYYIGDYKGPEAFIHNLLERAWRLRLGAYRVIEAEGYPWSTFFVVTLLTSFFIWVVIVVAALAYPVIWLIERFGGQEPLLKYSDYPFSVISIITASYITLVFLIYNLVGRG